MAENVRTLRAEKVTAGVLAASEVRRATLTIVDLQDRGDGVSAGRVVITPPEGDDAA